MYKDYELRVIEILKGMDSNLKVQEDYYKSIMIFDNIRVNIFNKNKVLVVYFSKIEDCYAKESFRLVIKKSSEDKVISNNILRYLKKVKLV